MTVCLDYGSRFIGVAITDADNRIALRHSVIDQKKTPALPALQELTQQEQVDTVVVGVPVSLSGKPSQQTLVTVDFIKQLRQALPKSVVIKTIDETLTSQEAEQRVRAEGLPVSEAHAEAARLMLEQFLLY